jgi:hypothetical protein
MSQKADHEDVKQVRSVPKQNKIWHYTRMAVCICTGGFGFPHAFAEGDENAPKPPDKATGDKAA